MSVNRMGPPCPACGSLTTDVMRTCRSETGDFHRRRKCPCCNHRFNTIQMRELLAPPTSAKWKDRKVTINWRRVSKQLLSLLQ
jgi:transcriptional regulator NrdR family protein